MAENNIDMRLFRKKSDSPAHQEYLDGLISSIRHARRGEEEKPGLHAFIEEDDYYPGATPAEPPRVPPGVSKPAGAAESTPEAGDASAVADLEAYLTSLNAADAARVEAEAEDRDAE